VFTSQIGTIPTVLKSTACQKGLKWQSKCGVFWMVDLLSAVHRQMTVAELMAAGWMNASPTNWNRVAKIKWGQFTQCPHMFPRACQKGLEWQSKCGVFRMVDLLSAVHQRTSYGGGGAVLAARQWRWRRGTSGGGWMNLLVNVECTIYLRISR
jgi:hypothetical protein